MTGAATSSSGVAGPRRRPWWRGALLVLGACLLALLAEHAGWLGFYDRAQYDLWHRLAGPQRAPERVALVAVDDATLLAHQHEPMAFWQEHFATAIATLRAAGAKVVGLDYLFQVSAGEWLRQFGVEDSIARTQDVGLRREFASGDVVPIGHVVSDEKGEAQIMLPIPELLYSLPQAQADVGLANLVLASDGVVRRFQPALFPDVGTPNVTFPIMLALRAAGLDPLSPEWAIAGETIQNSTEPRRFSFAGPPGSFPALSFERLLAPGAVDDPAVRALAGKVVIIASQESGTQDAHRTPYGPVLMTGGEIQANVVETLLSGRWPRDVARPLTVALLVLLVAVGAAAFLRLGPGKGAAAGLALAAGSGVGGYLCFRGDLIWSLGSCHLGLGLAYVGAIGLRLTGEEALRRRLRDMFGRYVSGEVVDELVNTGRMPDLGGRSQEVTVLFSDIRSFTTISETLARPLSGETAEQAARRGAEEVVEMLNAYLGRACDVIQAEGGTVDKFIGDAVMAVFGAPVAHPDHAARALTASLAMSRNAQEFAGWMLSRFADRDLPEFAIGIGMHTGAAMVGNIGSPQRMEYTVIGDTVNTASRMEGLTKTLAVPEGVKTPIAISAQVVEAAGRALELGTCENVFVKGRQEPVRVYAFLGFASEEGGES